MSVMHGGIGRSFIMWSVGLPGELLWRLFGLMPPSVRALEPAPACWPRPPGSWLGSIACALLRRAAFPRELSSAHVILDVSLLADGLLLPAAHLLLWCCAFSFTHCLPLLGWGVPWQVGYGCMAVCSSLFVLHRIV